MKKYFVVLVLFLVCEVCAVRTCAQNPNYVGFFDVGDCNVIAGWAADTNRLNTSINVSMYDGSALLTTVLANGSRPDVGSAIGDNGLHGFSIPFPTALKTGQSHAIGVRFESTSIELTNSPRSITCVHPRGEVGTATELVVDFKLQNGAPSIKGRLVGLNFTVRERTGATSHDVTAEVTHYRVRELPDLRDEDLSAQPWIPLPEHGLIHEMALRNGAGQRYGERKIMFQVKTATLTSSIVSDTITLEPVLKEYTMSASGSTHPLIQYAASQGFTFPLDYYETCKGDCSVGSLLADGNLASGTAYVSTQALAGGGGDNTVACVATITAAVFTLGLLAPVAVLACTNRPATGPAGTCSTKADYLLFEGRSPNTFWRIKSVDVPGTRVVGHGANRFRVKFSFDKKDATCVAGASIAVGDVVVEGPEVDDFVDPANPWKDAFVRPTIRPIQITPRPN